MRNAVKAGEGKERGRKEHLWQENKERGREGELDRVRKWKNRGRTKLKD